MRKYLLILIAALLSATAAFAQDSTGTKYYLDMSKDNTRHYFTYNSSTGIYELTVPILEGDFKIYNDSYVAGNNNQDQYIFGAADGQSSGVKPGDVKTLSHPGSNLSVEGGGILYKVTFEFDPTKMTLNIVTGSTTPPVPDQPVLYIDITQASASAPEIGTVNYTLYPLKIGSPETYTYTVTISYTNASGEAVSKSESLTGTLSGSFALDDLKIGSTTSVSLSATVTYNGSDLSASADGNIITPEIPILIGQLSGGVWQPDYGVTGTPYKSGRYYYHANLTDSGEFSFISKLDSSWDVVNSNPRYAPATSRVTAPNGTWVPYTRYSGSTENAWTPENFVSGSTAQYTVYFNFPDQSIMVYKGTLSGVEELQADIETTAQTSCNVYNIQGILLRSGVEPTEALADLPAGIYVVNGHKVLVH